MNNPNNSKTRAKKLILNWKSNFQTEDELIEFTTNLSQALADSKDQNLFSEEKLSGIIICPPEIFATTLMAHMEENLLGSAQTEALASISLGLQNIAHHSGGAYTGDTTATMAYSSGIDWVILGHSERREYYKESNQTISQKFSQACLRGINPILCVGYKDSAKNDYSKLIIDNHNPKTGLKEEQEINLGEIIEQIQIPIEGLKHNLEKGLGDKSFTEEQLIEFLSEMEIVVAYEPVWAIGTGKVASPKLVEEVLSYLHQSTVQLEKEFNKAFNVSPKIVFAYGGSIGPDNINSFGDNSLISGYLVGGASLDYMKVVAMLKNL